jgi:hypothetical protein
MRTAIVREIPVLPDRSPSFGDTAIGRHPDAVAARASPLQLPLAAPRKGGHDNVSLSTPWARRFPMFVVARNGGVERQQTAPITVDARGAWLRDSGRLRSQRGFVHDRPFPNETLPAAIARTRSSVRLVHRAITVPAPSR